MAALGTRARRTAFRKLKELRYRTSYSHRGGYYTLEELIDFDQHGPWSFRAVRFSAAGTQDALRKLVQRSPACSTNASAGCTPALSPSSAVGAATPVSPGYSVSTPVP